MRGVLGLVLGGALAACTSPNPDFRRDGPGVVDSGGQTDYPSCQPACDKRECGPDSCGGLCGVCTAPLTCNEQGRCVQGCKPSCVGRQCGPDGCGGSCGTCSTPLTCDEQSGSCVSACTPDCLGKECGPDGCGGTCGSCNLPQICDETAGKCVGQAACGQITYQGCCDGQTLWYCDNNKLRSQDCAVQPSCGWDAKNKFYNCGTAGQTDPSGQFPLKCP